jgi:uncharacterized membrane protein YqjE
MSNGNKPHDDAEKTLGDVVTEVSQKASLLIREEIELAKAEVGEKVSKLALGAGAGAAAGVFAIFGITMFFHTLAWFLDDLFNWEESIWVGFLIVTVLLFVFAGIAGLLAFRFIKRGSPPTPDMAIEEAKRTRAELEHQKIERDQVGRSLERGEELKV